MSLITVLCVDDDADIRHIVSLSLRLDRSLRVVLAASGAEALSLLEAEARPDLLLVDVMMPGMDGPELLDRVRARLGHQAPPVAFMTAKARAPDIAAYQARGAAAVISKPFDPMTLAGVVRALVERSRQAE